MTPAKRITLVSLLLALVALQALPWVSGLVSAGKPTQVAWVEESEASEPATADVRDSKLWRDAADECGIQWNLFDVSQIRDKYQTFVADAEAFGLPCVAVLYQSGKRSFVKPPPTAAEFAALIRKAG